ncbi:MAG: peptide chain release factor N(5)-glutamine methyltransferase [Xanthobacteraceae bacterium]
MPSAAKAGAAAVPFNGATSMTVDQARRIWAAKFRAGDLDSPELDARLLIGHALSLDHAGLAVASARELTRDEESAIAVLAGRRLAHEPIARIVGSKEFWGLEFAVGAATLVPRPETETVVEAALAAVEWRGVRARPFRVADLGTGSGAILLALLSELPNAFGVGTDTSPGALIIARGNARRLGLRRAAFVACDMAAALHGQFDVIVSNPPYVASADIGALPPDVRLFDPCPALDGGPDGLDFYRTIAAAAPSLLAADGVIVVELGAGQAEAVAALFAAAGLAPAVPLPDLTGVPRALVARK